MIKQLKNFIEEPTIAFVIDNSQSIKNDGLIEKLKKSEEKLTNAGYQVEWNSLSQNNIKIDSLKFDENISNLSKPIKAVESNFTNRHLISTILISDGIHNQGFSPEYINVSKPVYTIGIGDTTTQKDISIKEVFYNKIVYNGNKFPIKVQLNQFGFDNRNVNINLKKGGSTIQSKSVNLEKKSIHEVEFLVESKSFGKQLYSIEIEEKEDELTNKNNRRGIYIQIIDGKERVLVYAGAPHPDIKAIKSGLSKKENTEVVVYYDGFLKKPTGLFDLIVLHQFPSRKNKKDEVLKSFAKENTPVWHFIGNNSDIKGLNNYQKNLKATIKSSNNDDAFGVINNDFKGFELKSESLKNLQKLPPLSVPFGDFSFSGKASSLLFQQIGPVKTEKPILTFVENSNGIKNAYFIGEGLWRWRINEFALRENSDGIDELIQKTVRYITTKKDKRQLRVSPVKEEFFSDESTTLDVEVYNDIYEKIYQQDVELTISDESGNEKKFNFVNDITKSRFSLGRLEKGLYNFSAKTVVNGKTKTDEGSFVVKEQFIEQISTQADFNLLNTIASNNKGAFYSENNIDKLIDELILKEHKPKIVLTDETLKELINQKWLFFLIILLVTAEWGVRKYQGDY